MSFLSLLFFIYLLVIPLVIIGFGLWLWRYMNRMAYAPEKSILFTVIVMACLTFIAFSLGAKLNKQRQTPAAERNDSALTDLPVQEQSAQETRVPPLNNPQSTAEYPTGENQPLLQNMSQADKLRLFESANFPGLYEQRLELNRDIKDLEAFLQQIRQLAQKTPKQYSLLRDIAIIRNSVYEQLKQRNIIVSQHLRDFWVHYNTGNSHDAIKKFEPLAVQLTEKIKETRSELASSKRREAEVISTYMSTAGGSLKSHTIPSHQAGKITAYTATNRQLITDWLSEKGSVNILSVLNELLEQRTLINDRIKQIQSFRKLYPDLNNRLSRTENLWAQARESNYYAEYRLLYAAEARYVVEYMNLASNTADKRLDKELNTYTSAIAKHVETALEKAEQAYQPDSVR